MTLELVPCPCGEWHPVDHGPCDVLVHDHPPYRPPCNERVLPSGRLRGACLPDPNPAVSSLPTIPADRYLAPSHSRRARTDRTRPDQP